jgi:hypothetical protein
MIVSGAFSPVTRYNMGAFGAHACGPSLQTL